MQKPPKNGKKEAKTRRRGARHENGVERGPGLSGFRPGYYGKGPDANRKILEQQEKRVGEERLKVMLQMSGATAHEFNQPLSVLLRAGNIADAIPLLTDTKIDLVLLDYALPDENGFDFIKKAREKDIETTVVVLTGEGDERPSSPFFSKSKTPTINASAQPITLLKSIP